MDYRYSLKCVIVSFFCITGVFIFSGCTDKEKIKKENTYYIEVINCPDSIKRELIANISGKTSYHDKEGRLKIMSLAYVTDEYPDMHYYRSTEELKEPISNGVKKTRIEFSGNFRVDSTFYSIQRFKFIDKQWKKISDMGSIQAVSTNRRAKKTDIFGDLELVRIVTENIVAATY